MRVLYMGPADGEGAQVNRQGSLAAAKRARGSLMQEAKE